MKKSIIRKYNYKSAIICVTVDFLNLFFYKFRDQRITQDIDKFAETLSQIVTKLIIAPVMVIYYTYKCWIVTGFAGPLVIFVYFFLGSFISRKFIQPIVNAVFFKELQEGNFRSVECKEYTL